jgi:hypothetical protein
MTSVKRLGHRSGTLRSADRAAAGTGTAAGYAVWRDRVTGP